MRKLASAFMLAGMIGVGFTLPDGSFGETEVDSRIDAIQQELSQLKEQQIELKKEATAAAAAMPSFSYRPGNGMLIEAADKSWSFRHSFEAHMRYNFLERARPSRGAARASWKAGASGRSFICASTTVCGRSTGVSTLTVLAAMPTYSAA